MGKFFALVINIWTILIAIVLFIAEIGIRKIFEVVHFLSGFFGRGALQLFLGCLTLSALQGTQITDGNWLDIILIISGYICVVIGIIYLILGCCCSTKLKRERGEQV